MNGNYDVWSHGLKGLFDFDSAEMIHPANDRAKCFCYVVDKFREILQEESEQIVFFRNIRELPNKLLDYLAIEWGLPYYNETLDRATKVALIEEGFNWRREAGTIKGVENLAVKIFGQAKVYQWYEYGGEPGYFKISISTSIPGDFEQFFNRLMKKEKNARSWLEAIEKREDINLNTFMGVHTRTRYTINPTIGMRT